jgi:hypothetical protein
MPISTNDGWDSTFIPAAQFSSPQGKALDSTVQEQRDACQAADHKARAAFAKNELWNLTGKQFANESERTQADKQVFAACEAGYIDAETRDNVIKSFTVKPPPKTLAQRRAEIEARLADKESAFNMDPKTFKELWDSI